MGIKPCVIYDLCQRDPPQSFTEVCDEHHDADADTRAVSVALFDKDTFGKKGCHLQ